MSCKQFYCNISYKSQVQVSLLLWVKVFIWSFQQQATTRQREILFLYTYISANHSVNASYTCMAFREEKDREWLQPERCMSHRYVLCFHLVLTHYTYDCIPIVLKVWSIVDAGCAVARSATKLTYGDQLDSERYANQVINFSISRILFFWLSVNARSQLNASSIFIRQSI